VIPMTPPSKEAIHYGRRNLNRLIERWERWAQEYEKKGEAEKARSHRFHAWLLKRELGEGGCVVGGFDERWLDDDFRSMYESATTPVETQ